MNPTIKIHGGGRYTKQADGLILFVLNKGATVNIRESK